MLKINTTNFFIFNFPPYTYFAIIGFSFAICTYMLLLFQRRIFMKPQFYRLILSIPFLLIGAKLFGIPGLLQYAITNGKTVTLKLLLSGGIVYFGGLIFLLLGFYLLGKTKWLHDSRSWDCLAVAIPLFHTFGRIGCFFSGCCYGIPWNDFGCILYTNYINGVAITEARIPVQLFEACGNFLIFAILLTAYLKRHKNLLSPYFLLYCPLRFLLEFLRDDAIRGVFFGVSFSQWIALILFSVAIILKIKKKRMEKYESY